MKTAYRYKIAEEEWEFDLIHKLNYETFVREIPQHHPNKSKMLIDAYHDENTYFICMLGDELVGMVATRDKRPFSLDKKLDNVDSFFPSGLNLMEARLLSVKSNHRAGFIASNLISKIADYTILKQYDAVIISGTIRQAKLYKKLGFLPFASIVGKTGALYQPMYLSLERFRQNSPDNIKNNAETISRNHNTKFLPGPVTQPYHVSEGLNTHSFSHRNLNYYMLMKRVQSQLCDLANASHVQLLVGSGTLANDVIAGQLLQLKSKGLIVSNGEFGERLMTSAEGFNLEYDTIKVGDGKEFDYAAIEAKLTEDSDIKWLWMTHLETSTAVLNSIDAMKKISEKTGVKVCLDCISSLGNTQVDLSWAYMASSVSGKGLLAYTGFSFVFHNRPITKPEINIPQYMNLYYYQECDSIPFSGSSNLLCSLSNSLEHFDLPSRINCMKKASEETRKLLDEHGFYYSANPLAESIIINLSIPDKTDACKLGKYMENHGFILHFRSKYLTANNLIQICFMSNPKHEDIAKMVELLNSGTKLQICNTLDSSSANVID